MLTELFLPGALQGYASNYRLPREDFFRACGRNLWRFIRLLLMAAIIMGIAAAALFGLQGLIATKAAESTNGLLAPELQLAGLAVIFLIMTLFRIVFDLAEADIVLSNQNKVRKSIAAGFRHAFGSFFRLMASYVLITIVALVILAAGLFVWEKHVPPASVAGAAIVSQIILLLLLIPRFWQRAVAVAYYKQNMVQPVVAFQPFIPTPVVTPVATPVVPEPPARTRELGVKLKVVILSGAKDLCSGAATSFATRSQHHHGNPPISPPQIRVALQFAVPLYQPPRSLIRLRPILTKNAAADLSALRHLPQPLLHRNANIPARPRRSIPMYNFKKYQFHTAARAPPRAPAAAPPPPPAACPTSDLQS